MSASTGCVDCLHIYKKLHTVSSLVNKVLRKCEYKISLQKKPDKTLVFKFKHCVVCTQNITTRWTVDHIQINVASVQPKHVAKQQPLFTSNNARLVTAQYESTFKMDLDFDY